MHIEPYLFFDGNCEQALDFYAQCLEGRLTAVHRYEGSPLEKQLPAHWRNKIMHATLEAPGGHRFMASDRMPGQPFAGHAGFSMSVNCPGSAERGERIFHSLAVGGHVGMPFTVTFWGAHFGTLVDKFGVGWMVNCDGAQPPA
ncbi:MULTISPECIES: VOC family protein [unclassified Acidovorax]|uniref:VOC family protein n=1 Tax=unclassified Acidovorax TaxID=2684926 RepID=UPI0023DE36AE|nr:MULTISPECIES: VOC family protein [unclassified Acidovorax]GKS88056.1 VOC family protein [Acidovorax sp. SUPP2539]GKS93189.1 VOC family protein [Acidovorax sp. SUPP2825]